MHLRASSITGMSILDDSLQEIVGIIDEPLIHPDTGSVLGFFVYTSLSFHRLFLSWNDILSFGKHIHIRSVDCIGEPSEFVRLSSIFSDERRILSFPIQEEGTGRSLGVCSDVQFSTKTASLEWLFPKRYLLFSGTPLPASSILEVTQSAILVRSSHLSMKAREKEDVATLPPPIIIEPMVS